MKEVDLKIIKGKVNVDVDMHSLPADSVMHALNIRSGVSGVVGAVSNMQGNELIAFTLPDGDNQCIGSCEDKTLGTIIYFVHNSEGDHGIYRYWPDDGPDGRIENLIIQESLAFELSHRIHSSVVIDGKLLYWANASDFREGLSGLPPRKLNIEKASLYGKRLSYEMVLADNAYNTGAVYAYSVRELDGTIIVPSTTLYTVPAGPPSRQTIVNAIIAAFGAANIEAEYIDINSTGTDQLIISHLTAERRLIVTCTGTIFFSPLNHYPEVIDAEMLTVIKPVPKCSPRPRYVVDADYTETRVFDYAFQFRYRYVFDDNERSAWSSASYVPTNFVPWPSSSSNLEVENSQGYNLIKILFSDPLLSSVNWRCFIRHIELAVRYNESDIWRYVEKYPIYKLGVTTFSLDFYNESTFPAVPSDEASDVSSQALKNFDWVPLLSSSVEVVADESGSSLMLWGGNLEGNERIEVRADLEILADAAPVSPYPSEQTTLYKGLKSGGVYRACVAYEDEWGRQTVYPIGRIRVPFTQIGTAIQYLGVEFNTVPPIWALRYRIGLSKNQNQSRYVQRPCFSVTYWIYNPTDDTMASTNYGAGDANYVGFDFNISDLNADVDIRNYIFEVLKDSSRIFLPEPKDRIQVLNWDIHTGPSSLDVQDYNYPIAGYSLTYPNDTVSDPAYRFTVFVKFDPSQPDYNDAGSSEGANDWILMEIYRPGTVTSDDIFYELGDCYDIEDNIDPLKRTHGDPVELQYFGDTYYLAKEFSHKFNGSTVTTITVPHIQRPSLHAATPEILNDFGRALTYNPDQAQVYNWDQVRSTGIYVPNSGVNQLNSFRATDYIKVNRSFGPISKLCLNDRVLLVVCAFKAQPVYIGKDRTIDLSGNTLIGKTSTLLNIADELNYDFGSMNPSSIQREQGIIFGFDIYKGVLWAYTSGGGQNPISNQGYSSFFTAWAIENVQNLDSIKVIGGIDRRFNTYFISMDNGESPVTIGFNYDEKEWRGEYSIAPEAWGWAGLKLVAFKDAELWLSERGDYCNFFGVQHEWSITPVFNPYADLVKIPWSISVNATIPVQAPEIIIPGLFSYAGGMASRIPYNYFVNYEGQFKADFLRDETDESEVFSSIVDPSERLAASLLRGRPLRGEALSVKLSAYNPSAYCIIRAWKIMYSKSQK